MPYDFKNARCIAERVREGTVTDVYVAAPDLGQPTWFPYKHIDEDSEVYRKGHEGTFIISEWLAEMRGFL